MSYDLGFFPRDGMALPSVDALDAHFRARPGYTVEPGSARYANEHTGVWFRFDYGDHRDEEGWDPIRLAASTGGPHTRALELAAEVEALVRAFDLLVNDGTIDGMDKGPLDREALIRGCLKASRFGFAVDVAWKRLTKQNVMLYDDDRMTAHWRWNHAHDATARATPDRLFVPYVTYLASRRLVLASVAWTGTMPILLPEVDVITTMDPAAGALKIVAVSDLASQLAAHPRGDKPAPHWILDPPSPALLEAVGRAPSMAPPPEALDVSSVLGRAYWQQILADWVAWSGGGKYLTFSDTSEKKAPKKKSKTSPKKKKPTAKKSKKPPAQKKAAPKKKPRAPKKPAKRKRT
jgi:hypothetical protein